ncbi:MAG: glutathione S-transferase [Myxococcota bacterium]|jgi:glutathione S-transferase
MSDITVHHLNRSRSTRILWMLEELELPYTLKVYKRNPKTMRAPPELAEVHPLGRAPVVSVGEQVLAESGAILEHFADSHPTLRPTDPAALQEYRFWLHYAEGSLMPPLLVRLILNRLRTTKLPFLIKPVAKGIADKIDANFSTPAIQQHFAFIEAHLAENAWFAGDEFTAADIQMSYPVAAGLPRAGLTTPTPAIAAWLAKIEARPAHQRAIEKGGPVA